MAKKQTTRFIWPLIILLVLVGLILVLIDPLGWRKPSAEQLKAQDPARFTLCSATADEITSIEIIKPQNQPFTLVKEGANWFVEMAGNRYRAEQLRVDSMLQDLPGLESDSMATDKADQLATYEVDDAQGVHLIVYTGDKQVACDLIVGKAAPGYKSAFVRKPDETKVYRATKNIKSLVGFAYANFRGKQLWPFSPEGATALTVKLPGAAEGAVFSRQTGAFWQTAAGANGNQNAINELVQKLSELRINDYVDELDGVETGLADPAAPNLSVTATEGAFSLELGRLDEEKGQYFVRDQDGHVSMVGQASVKFLLDADLANLEMEQLPEETPAETDPGAAPEGVPALPPVEPPAGLSGK